MDGNDFQYGHMNNGAGWLIGLLLVLLLVAAVAALVVVITRSTATPGSAAPAVQPDGHARRILDERLARGEIDANEYRERRAALGG
jgi:putative membrane protein